LSGYNAVAPAPPLPKIMYRAEEAAALMSLSRTAVYALIRSGDLDAVKIGHRRRIPSSSIDDYVKRQLAADKGTS
jgi:excisionase family DNA binding protein